MHQKRGLSSEDLEEGQGPLVKEVFYAVIAQVDDAEQLASVDHRDTHDRGELKVHHALGFAKTLVSQCVRHNERFSSVHHAVDDGIGNAREVQCALVHIVSRREMPFPP